MRLGHVDLAHVDELEDGVEVHEGDISHDQDWVLPAGDPCNEERYERSLLTSLVLKWNTDLDSFKTTTNFGTKANKFMPRYTWYNLLEETLK